MYPFSPSLATPIFKIIISLIFFQNFVFKILIFNVVILYINYVYFLLLFQISFVGLNMSLYDDIEMEKTAASGWATGIKMMHSQMAFKKATVAGVRDFFCIVDKYFDHDLYKLLLLCLIVIL